MIEIKGLKKSFGKDWVLNGIDLSIKEGTISGLVGANGAGKTTLFKCLIGLEKHEGEIKFPENKINIGFLPSNPEYLSKMTGKEYLHFVCKARKIEGVDINDYNLFELPLEKYAANYSTGMKKKLALTGLLLQKNDLFILDEPFSGVDFESNLLIKGLINSLHEANKTIIISSHILSTLTELCDQIHFLNEGKIDSSIAKKNFDSIDQNIEFIGIADKLTKLKF